MTTIPFLSKNEALISRIVMNNTSNDHICGLSHHSFLLLHYFISINAQCSLGSSRKGCYHSQLQTLCTNKYVVNIAVYIFIPSSMQNWSCFPFNALNLQSSSSTKPKVLIPDLATIYVFQLCILWGAYPDNYWDGFLCCTFLVMKPEKCTHIVVVCPQPLDWWCCLGFSYIWF